MAGTRTIALHRGLPALLGWLLGWHAVHDADVFWHLTLGRAVLRHHSRVVPEPSAHLAWSEPCVVKEWLWDVACYALYTLGGMPLVAWLLSTFGALIGYRAARLLEPRVPERPRALHTLLALLAVCGVAEVLDARPNLVFFALLLVCLELSLRYAAAATARERNALGIGLCVLELCWAQLHASYVLGPALFLLALGEARAIGVHGVVRSLARSDAPVFLLMLLGLLTSAHGWSALELVLSHAGGDATEHITDMRSLDFSQFALAWHVPLGIVALFSLGIAGVCVGGKRALAGVSFALLGALMASRNTRFVFVWPLLCLPWASTALGVLNAAAPHSLRRLEFVYALLTAGVLLLASQRADAIFGPFFVRGLRAGDQPEAAAHYLQRLPRGSAVFTEFTLGAPLGFWLDGRVRTFVDGRTPMYFDSTDYALARDMLAIPGAWQRALARYGFAAAVVDRNSSLCPTLAASWTAVLVEARFTTFIASKRENADAVRGLAACGPLYLEPNACSDAGRALFDTLARQRRLLDSPFLHLMNAAAALQCGGRAPDPAAFPDRRESRAFMPSYRLYRAWALLAEKRTEEALAVVREGLAADDPLAARVFLLPAAGEVPIADARSLLDRALAQMDDNAPPALRARLARLCQAEGDAECARFQGLRAWLAGDETARVSLEWAAEHHASARVRRDLQAWLALHE